MLQALQLVVHVMLPEACNVVSSMIAVGNSQHQCAVRTLYVLDLAQFAAYKLLSCCHTSSCCMLQAHLALLPCVCLPLAADPPFTLDLWAPDRDGAVLTVTGLSRTLNCGPHQGLDTPW